MGAGASSSMGPEFEGEGYGTGLGDLPESCVAEMLRNLPPTEICRLGRLSRTFGLAASSDFVWEMKLPANYKYLVELLGDRKARIGAKDVKLTTSSCVTKKEIYAQLCRPNRFDGGTKEFWLEKDSGRICMSISLKALVVTGIDDRRYWNRIPTEESRFNTVAYLQQTWWFQVDGEIGFCFPAGTYSLYFRLHLGRMSRRLGRRVVNTEHVHGWNIKPVQFQLWTSDGQHILTQCHLDDPGIWVLYHAGDFTVRSSEAMTKLKFSMTQIDCTHTKGGLCVDSVFIYPK